MNRKISFLITLIVVSLQLNSQIVCTEIQGFYGNKFAKGCYNNSSIETSIQFMLNAFGSDASVVFGNVTNRRFFTLYQTDISNQNIIKMLPGAHPGKQIGVDNVLPYDGAYYDDPTTWSLVPIQASGTFKGRINNLLLAQTITLWFNVRISSSLGSISLAEDTLIIEEQTSCGSGIGTGTTTKFGLPHNIIVFLNGGNGYTNDVNGLLQLANDVLGAVTTSVTINDVQQAVVTINRAFAGCRILVGTIPAAISKKKLVLEENERLQQKILSVQVNPNPGSLFNVTVQSSDPTRSIDLKVVDLKGRVIEEKIVAPNSTILLGHNYSAGIYILKVMQGSTQQQIKLVKFNTR